MAQECMSLKKITKTVHLNYLLYLPEGYGERKDWPLVMFLHGVGERGNDLELVKVHGIPKIAETSELPFVAVVPQCPDYCNWDMLFDDLYELLKEIKSGYDIDEDRVYLTGLSMGGHGTWAFAVQHPDEFAAIVPICGWLIDANDARRLADMPIWVFHGAKDTAVPVHRSEALVDVLRRCGADVKFTVYPEAEHDSWTATYSDPSLYEWLLSQKRKSR